MTKLKKQNDQNNTNATLWTLSGVMLASCGGGGGSGSQNGLNITQPPPDNINTNRTLPLNTPTQNQVYIKALGAGKTLGIKKYYSNYQNSENHGLLKENINGSKLTTATIIGDLARNPEATTTITLDNRPNAPKNDNQQFTLGTITKITLEKGYQAGNGTAADSHASNTTTYYVSGKAWLQNYTEQATFTIYPDGSNAITATSTITGTNYGTQANLYAVKDTSQTNWSLKTYDPTTPVSEAEYYKIGTIAPNGDVTYLGGEISHKTIRQGLGHISTIGQAQKAGKGESPNNHTDGRKYSIIGPERVADNNSDTYNFTLLEGGAAILIKNKTITNLTGTDTIFDTKLFLTQAHNSTDWQVVAYPFENNRIRPPDVAKFVRIGHVEVDGVINYIGNDLFPVSFLHISNKTTGATLAYTGDDSGDFEANDAKTVAVKITDENNNETYQTYTIRLRGVDEDPVFTSRTSGALTEDSRVVNNYRAAAHDPDADAGLFFLLIAGGTGRNVFSLDQFSGILSVRAGQKLDYEDAANRTYTLVIRAYSNTYNEGTRTKDQTVTITVLDVNEAPVITYREPNDISVSAAVTADNVTGSQSSLVITDEDAGDNAANVSLYYKTAYGKAAAAPTDTDSGDIALAANGTPLSIAGQYGTWSITRTALGEVSWGYTINVADADTIGLAFEETKYEFLSLRAYDDDTKPLASEISTIRVAVQGALPTGVLGGANDQNNTLISSTAAQIISGKQGDDTITSGGGADLIAGGTGEDRINLPNGYNRDDEISAGTAPTIVTDGLRQTVYYRWDSSTSKAIDGGDTINNFRLGEDRLVLVDMNSTAITDFAALKSLSARPSVEFISQSTAHEAGVKTTIKGVKFIFALDASDGAGRVADRTLTVHFDQSGSEFVDVSNSVVFWTGVVGYDFSSRKLTIEQGGYDSVLPWLFTADAYSLSYVAREDYLSLIDDADLPSGLDIL